MEEIFVFGSIPFQHQFGRMTSYEVNFCHGINSVGTEGLKNAQHIDDWHKSEKQ